MDETCFRIRTEEQPVLSCLREDVIKNLVKLQRNAAIFDDLDVACAFAILAVEKNFVRPILSAGPAYNIVGGRHPVVEASLLSQGRRFAPNDCVLGPRSRIHLITEPNMAGKSTYLRQNALISILAQTGSFVPATYAEICLVDKSFSRVGSADNLYQDQSTFMVEMLETAQILKEATPRSFVTMDISSSQRAPPPLPRTISPSITLQPPLSRRGKGPGLVLVLDHYAAREAKDGCLDPSPLQKWAEEGFAVVQLLVPGKVEDGGEFPLRKALEALKNCKGCEFSNSVGLISAGSTPDIKALVSYGGGKFTTIGSTPLPPQLIHIAGLPDTRRRDSCSLVPGPSSEDTTPLPKNVIKSYRYEDAKKESGWVLPSDENYHKQSAGIAHTRSLTFLKPLLGGPFFDLEAVCGGVGQERLTAFYTHHFVFSNPPDTALSLVSRTVGINRVIDEFIFTLTHTKEVPWLLPGIPPTGRPLAIPFTSVVAMRGDRLCHEHINWDHATTLKQLGLLLNYVPFPYEIEGEAKPEGKRYEVKFPVVGMEGSSSVRTSFQKGSTIVHQPDTLPEVH
ncbi:dienelactone hydrolase [Stemphylium lycopersici]|nr:dienelactone hydrolase [Stemphylium lycopersici]